jgi:hypothetical protein
LACAVVLSLIAGCKSSESAPKPAPNASSSVGLIGISAPSRAAAPPGFEACRDDFAHDSDLKKADEAYDALLKRPAKLSLISANPRARRHPGKLIILAGSTTTIELGDWAHDVRVTAAELERFSSWKYELADYKRLQMDGILPLDALAAYASVGGSGFGFSARFYVVRHGAKQVAKTLDREGSRILRIVACAQQDGPYHRAAFRIRYPKGGRARGVILTPSIYGGDTGNSTPSVDFRVAALDATRTLVIACGYGSDKAQAKCDGLVKAQAR